MTDQNNAAQPGLTEAIAVLKGLRNYLFAHRVNGPSMLCTDGKALNNADDEVLRALKILVPLSKLRAADDTLTQVYDRFGIGVLARNPSTLMACLGNVIRRANCLSQVEQVLSVPTPPEPEDDGVGGEESLLRWGADEKGYAEHFKAAMAEWSRCAPVADERAAFEAEYAKMLDARDTPPTFAAFMRNPDGSYALPIVERAWAMWQARAALASAPVAGEAQKPVAYRAWFDQDNGARWLFTLWPEEERLDVQWEPLYAAPQASEAQCSCPSGDGSLRHPCAVHPTGDKDGGDCAKGAVQVCPECDIAGCKHIREALSPTQPTEQGERDE